MFKEIFANQRQFINFFFDHIDLNEAQIVLANFLKCKGMIVFTGVGKSGMIADKLSKTMMSIGTRSIYLPPTGALHGDIGILAQEDIVVILSKSGKSAEVLEFAAAIKKKKIQSMAWVSTRNSPLSNSCDITIHLPLEREICPFDLVPTTSTIVQLIFGDIIAIALMRAKEFTIHDYALNHPGGAIGKLISQRVEDVMISGDALPLCKVGDKLIDAVVELSKKKCGCLLVVDDEMRLEGIFTDGDLRRGLEMYREGIFGMYIKNLMSSVVVHATTFMLTSQAVSIMNGEKKVMMLPVIKEEKVVGLVHMHHILN